MFSSACCHGSPASTVCLVVLAAAHCAEAYVSCPSPLRSGLPFLASARGAARCRRGTLACMGPEVDEVYGGGGQGLGRREAISVGFAALLAGAAAPGKAGAELTPFMEGKLRDTGAIPGMRGTEINGKLIDSDCKGSRGNRCNVWTPPEVEASPDIANAGKRGAITCKVYMDVRVITDYTGEVLEDSAKRGRIVIGLYGKDSPLTAEQFLKFVRADDSYPSYNSGMFYKHQAGRWIEGGRINGLNLEEFGGGQAYQYLSKIINLKPILEVNDLAHSRKNLLTHRKLNAGPEFAITLSPAPELDGSWTVFGEVLEGEELVNEIAGLPFVTGKSLDPDGTIADSWWKAQNRYFLGLAKQFGDSRAGKMYPGKLLRRVEIVKCGQVA